MSGSYVDSYPSMLKLTCHQIRFYILTKMEPKSPLPNIFTHTTDAWLDSKVKPYNLLQMSGCVVIVSVFGLGYNPTGFVFLMARATMEIRLIVFAM